MAVFSAFVTFVVSLLVGGLAIFLSARLVTGEKSYGYAVFTALIGAIVWGLADLLLGWVPLFGPLLVLLSWVWVIRWRYDENWVNATIIGFVAWAASVLVLSVLPFGRVDVLGVPFV